MHMEKMWAKEDGGADGTADSVRGTKDTTHPKGVPPKDETRKPTAHGGV